LLILAKAHLKQKHPDEQDASVPFRIVIRCDSRHAAICQD
jgi:hypothetical protein